MVRKLFKHELKSYLRILLPVWGGLLGIALLARCIQFFEQDSVAYDIFNGSSIFVYVVGILACAVFPFILAIIRFYKNLFSGEGYLSFTLPVTPFQHIWVKLSAAVLLQAITVLVMLLSVTVITAGDVLGEIGNAIGYLGGKLFAEFPGMKVHLWLYLLEALLFFMLADAATLLLYDTCIAVGQMFKKNRVLAAVGVYGAYYVFNQIIGTVFLVIITLVDDWDAILEPISVFAEDHSYLFVHLALWLFIVLTAVLGVVYFAITHTVIRKRLNLE